LDDWTLKELTGHYVNYRKHVSGPSGEMLPESSFRLLGVSTRFPQKLVGQVKMEGAGDGVYQVARGTDQIVVIVLNEVPREAHNSFWHLFSGVPANIQYGAAHYRRRTDDASTILNRLFESYQQEGVVMPYTIEDFRRDFTKEHLSLLSPQDLVEGLTPRQIQALRQQQLGHLSPKERVEGLSLREMQVVFEELRRQIEQSKAGKQTGKRAARRKQEGTPNRPSSRRKPKGS
jgi:hypothetical protein